MADLRTRADEITAAFGAHARAVGRSTAFVKVVLVLGGTSIIAVAQCLALPATGPWPIWSVVGLIGTALAFFGGVAVVFTERSASDAIAVAQRTLEDAREVEAESENIFFYIAEVRRATELYGATMLMRKAVESMVSKPPADMEMAAAALLEIADRPLRLALGFQAADHWTIGIYCVEGPPGARMLRCCAQMRSEKCDIKNARKWPEGRGAGWIALANENDVVIPDVKSPAMGTIFGGMLSTDDLDRYRSVAAVPIYVPDTQEKWGAIVATSDQEGHFSPDTRPGVRPLEAAKALSGMVALALAAQKRTGKVS